jgi:hypothetical protein
MNGIGDDQVPLGWEVFGEPDRAGSSDPAEVTGSWGLTGQDLHDCVVRHQDLAGEGVADALLGDAAGIVVHVVQGAEHVVVAAH